MRFQNGSNNNNIINNKKNVFVKKVRDNAVLLGTYCILLLCIIIYLAFSYCYICIVTIKNYCNVV